MSNYIFLSFCICRLLRASFKRSREKYNSRFWLNNRQRDIQWHRSEKVVFISFCSRDFAGLVKYFWPGLDLSPDRRVASTRWLAFWREMGNATPLSAHIFIKNKLLIRCHIPTGHFTWKTTFLLSIENQRTNPRIGRFSYGRLFSFNYNFELVF